MLGRGRLEGPRVLPHAGWVLQPDLIPRRAKPSLTHANPLADFDDATALFGALQRADPYRLEDLDVLSNILYVSEKRAELATLAQEYMRVDRLRPETCCLVGTFEPSSLSSERRRSFLAGSA